MPHIDRFSLEAINCEASEAAVMKATEKPRWQAARPKASAICVLPVPLLPGAMMFSRATTNSHRASSSSIGLLSAGSAP